MNLTNKNIQLPYQIIMAKVSEESFEQIISVKQMRRILNYKFRMGRQNLNKIFVELQFLGIIEYLDPRTLKIIKTF